MRVIAVLLACTVSGVAAAQTPMRGDFDGDGRPDTLLVLPDTSFGSERIRVVVRLAASPGKDFFLVSGPADLKRSIEILPPGTYQLKAGRLGSRELTLTADSVKLTIEPAGQPARAMLKVWDPDVPAFAGYSLPD